LGTSTIKSKVETPKVTPKKDDEDDELFSPKPLQVKLPPPVVLPPLPSAPAIKTNVYEDPLFGIRKPIEITPQPPISELTKTPSAPIVQPTKTNLADSEDEDLFPKRQLNTAALKEGEKPNVKALTVRQTSFQKRKTSFSFL
jgi:hypothetical protein